MQTLQGKGGICFLNSDSTRQRIISGSRLEIFIFCHEVPSVVPIFCTSVNLTAVFHMNPFFNVINTIPSWLASATPIKSNLPRKISTQKIFLQTFPWPINPQKISPKTLPPYMPPNASQLSQRLGCLLLYMTAVSVVYHCLPAPVLSVDNVICICHFWEINAWWWWW